MNSNIPNKWLAMAEKYGASLLAQVKNRKWKYIHRVHGRKLQMSYAEIVNWGKWLAKGGDPLSQKAAKPNKEPNRKPNKEPNKIEINVNGNTLNIESRGMRVQTLEELLSAAKVDMEVWRVDSYRVNTWESASKINDDICVTPLWQVKANLVKIVADTQEFPAVQPVRVTVTPQRATARSQKRPKTRTCLVVPDSQNGYRREYETGFLDPMHDRLAWDLVVQVAKESQPDVVVLLGDMLDLADWSDKYVTSPDMYHTTQPTVIELSWWIARLRAACPESTEFVYLEGNHEQRMDRAILKHIPSAYGLKGASGSQVSLSVPALLDLEALRVDYYSGYPDAEYWLTDRIKFSHGMVVRAGGGKTSSEVIKKSAVTQGFGHIHRLELAARTTHGRDGACSVYAFSPGTICRLDGVVPGYKKLNDWQQGIGLVHYSTSAPDHSVELIPINEGRLIWQGVIMSGADRLDELIEDTGDWFVPGRA